MRWPRLQKFQLLPSIFTDLHNRLDALAKWGMKTRLLHRELFCCAKHELKSPLNSSAIVVCVDLDPKEFTKFLHALMSLIENTLFRIKYTYTDVHELYILYRITYMHICFCTCKCAHVCTYILTASGKLKTISMATTSNYGIS